MHQKLWIVLGRGGVVVRSSGVVGHSWESVLSLEKEAKIGSQKMENKWNQKAVSIYLSIEARGKVCEHVYSLGTLNLLIMITRDCKKR